MQNIKPLNASIIENGTQRFYTSSGNFTRKVPEKYSLRHLFELLHNGEDEQGRKQTKHDEHAPHHPQLDAAPQVTDDRHHVIADSRGHEPPIIIPLYFGGATLDTKEMPMGDNNNSANVNTR